MSPPLSANLLGPVRVMVGEQELANDAWPRRSARSLLLLLLATPGHALPRDRVLDRLWPESSPAAALNALYVAVHGLRRTLEPGLATGRDSVYVDAGRETIRLRPGIDLRVDADAFEQALARAGAAQGSDRRAALEQAIALYGGDLIAEEPYLEWVEARRRALRGRWREAVMRFAGIAIDDGEPSAAIPALDALVVSDETDEEATRTLMRVLAEAGRRDDALRRFERCATVLRTTIEVEPDEATAALAAAIRATSAVAPGPVSRAVPSAIRCTPLPAPPNPLIGRTRELEAIQDLLWQEDARMVTITGPGGIGKTRLVLEVAAQIAADFADGVCFVPLATLQEPALVTGTIARGLGVDDGGERSLLAQIGESLRERELLLVLDNFEQLVEAAADIADLLAVAAGLTILVTSREPLRLRAEHEFAISPLPLPPVRANGGDGSRQTGELETLQRYEAVALFVQRARAVQRTPVLTIATAPAIVTICHRLDGLPLALELAAARSRTHAPDDLLAALGDRFAVLAEGYRDLPLRQRTMRDAIAWSYDLLDATEQALFRRLAVLVGGWTLEAAAAVCTAAGNRAPPSMDDLRALSEKSLSRVVDEDEPPRFTMLETIREFGLERLAASGEEPATRRAHAAYFLALAERAEPELGGAEQTAWFDQLDREHDNLRSALTWAIEHQEPETALRIGAALWRFWSGRSYLSEGRRWLEQALTADGEATLASRAAALTAAGSLASEQDDQARAAALNEAALAAWEEVGDRPRMARVLDSLGNVADDGGDYQRGRELHERALALYREADDGWGMAAALNNLGAGAYYQGEYERAERQWQESLALAKANDDVRSQAVLLNNLGALALQQGDAGLAHARHEESLVVRRRIGEPLGIASSLMNLGETIFLEGDLARAEALLEESIPICRRIENDRLTGLALHSLGVITFALGNIGRAATLLGEGLALFHEVGDRFSVAGSLEGLAEVFQDQGDAGPAARLFAVAAVLREETGAARETVNQERYERSVAATRTALGDEAFAAAWAAGEQMPLDAAVREALAAVAIG